ncbi:MAG TPA: FAD-dependent oxidoreductase [Chthoniobacterales bacterium]|nr:FAD-dependent oxidoreductase [Chthoniobacterales bacterium]
MTPVSFDVAIVGGGPGGAATALSLRARAPALSVVLIEASHYEAVRIGETLPPPVRSLLAPLGVWDAFQAQGHREVYGTTAAWGSAALLDNDFIYMPANTGWHLDRAAFDAMLARAAQEQGATLLLDTRVSDSKRTGNEWQLTLSTGQGLAARFLVDATGGAAALARRCGARFVEADNLVGIAGFFQGCDGNPSTLVEAFEDGWWYTAGLSDGRRIVACMTDVDLVKRMKLHDPQEWQRALGTMANIAATVERGRFTGQLAVRPASSRRLEPAAGRDWLAVGDSASRFDPLSSQGIFKALRSGIFASYAIGDLLTRHDESGLERYRRFVLDEFKSYAEVRTKYYREEQRWPESEFWLRRHEAQAIGKPHRQSEPVFRHDAARRYKSSPA